MCTVDFDQWTLFLLNKYWINNETNDLSSGFHIKFENILEEVVEHWNLYIEYRRSSEDIGVFVQLSYILAFWKNPQPNHLKNFEFALMKKYFLAGGNDEY